MSDVLHERWRIQRQCGRTDCHHVLVTHAHRDYPYVGYCNCCAIKVNAANNETIIKPLPEDIPLCPGHQVNLDWSRCDREWEDDPSKVCFVLLARRREEKKS